MKTDLTPLLNLLAIYQSKAQRLARIESYAGASPALMLAAEDAHYAARPINARISYLADFIRSLSPSFR